MTDCILHAVSSVIPIGYYVILFVVISVPTEIICWYLSSISYVVLFMVHVQNCTMHVYNSTSISMKRLRVSLHIGSETLHEYSSGT